MLMALHFPICTTGTPLEGIHALIEQPRALAALRKVQDTRQCHESPNLAILASKPIFIKPIYRNACSFALIHAIVAQSPRRPIHEHGSANYILFWKKTPDMAIQTLVSVVT
jgi:hypothetical protein